MKKACDIIKSLQNLPHFHKLLELKCIDNLKSVLLPTLQRIIKYAYIKNEVLYLIFLTNLNKYDKDNIINTIKLLLNSQMLAEANLECKNIKIVDVVCKVDYKDKSIKKIYYSSIPKYTERATGKRVVLRDAQLQKIADDISTIITSNIKN